MKEDQDRNFARCDTESALLWLTSEFIHDANPADADDFDSGIILERESDGTALKITATAEGKLSFEIETPRKRPTMKLDP